MKPVKTNKVDHVFGGDIGKLMPNYAQIPDEFKVHNGVWPEWQSKWFFDGLKEGDMPTPKEGIDLEEAMAHLSSIQRSYEPKHEHKSAAVAYLASQWFETPKAAK